MAVIDIVNMVFNPIFGWMLDIPPILAILILSLVLGGLNILLQKYLTDQAKLKRLKADTKKFQKRIKEAQKNKDNAEMMKLNQQIMPIQMDMMKESFRPLFVTLIPFLLIFFWLSNHFAFHPITPGEEFTVTATFDEGVSGMATLNGSIEIDNPTQEIENGQVIWTAKGDAGRHILTLQFAGAEYEREVLITAEKSYVTPQQDIGGTVEQFNVNNKKLLPLGDGFNLFGWKPGWIFYYIILSIPISLGLKKILKVV